MERLMLLDGNGLIYRGYFALIETPLTTSKGELVNAVFGFCNIVLRAFQDVRPDYAAIAFDLPSYPYMDDIPQVWGPNGTVGDPGTIYDPDTPWNPVPFGGRHRLYVANETDQTIYAGYLTQF